MLAAFTTSTSILTPNGDGHHCAPVLSYRLLQLLAPAVVRLEVFDEH